MAEKREDHERFEERRRIYAEARVDGKGPTEAKRIAGYSENTRQNKLERGAVVERKIRDVLDERGITDKYLADEYFDGISQAKEAGSKDKNLSAHAQYLKQLGYLLGHTKQAPSVAVQINNHSGTSKQLEPGRVERLVELLEAELGRRDADGIHDVDPVESEGSGILAEIEARPGVDAAGDGAQKPPGGSGA